MIKLMIINTLEQAHKLSHYKYFQMKPNQIISFISCKGFFLYYVPLSSTYLACPFDHLIYLIRQVFEFTYTSSSQ